MAKKKDINEVIKEALNSITAKYALQDKNDNERVYENMLYALWLTREHIHKMEKELLENLNPKNKEAK
ncbi:hypothetical protein ACWIUD_07665 [Helicobacter sp. 23-1044]